MVIPKLVPEDLLDHCRDRFIDIVDGKVAKGGITMMRDVSLKVIHKVSNFQSFCYDSKI